VLGFSTHPITITNTHLSCVIYFSCSLNRKPNLSCRPLSTRKIERSFCLILFLVSQRKIWVTVVIFLISMVTLLRYRSISKYHHDISWLSQYWTNNISKAFFADLSDFKMERFRLDSAPIVLLYVFFFFLCVFDMFFTTFPFRFLYFHSNCFISIPIIVFLFEVLCK